MRGTRQTRDKAPPRGTATFPPEQRAAFARMGAYALHAQRDSHATTQAAREAKQRHWRAQVDPDGELARRDPQELARRVKAAAAAEMERARFAKLRKAQERAEERRMVEQATAQELERARRAQRGAGAEIPLHGAMPAPGEVEAALAALAQLPRPSRTRLA